MRRSKTDRYLILLLLSICNLEVVLSQINYKFLFLKVSLPIKPLNEL